jgi:hypothetical protein
MERLSQFFEKSLYSFKKNYKRFSPISVISAQIFILRRYKKRIGFTRMYLMGRLFQFLEKQIRLEEKKLTKVPTKRVKFGY